MTPFRFASPYWLALFVPLAIVAALDLAYARRKKAPMLFSSTFGLDRIPISLAARFKKFLPALAYLGAAALIVALARPQFGIRESRVVGNGISIVMCVDRSGSMAAEDFEINGRPVTRLEAVKKVFRDFVEGSKDFHGRTNDLIGLIAFGGFVDSCCPLTLDHASLIELLDTIDTPIPLFDRRGNMIRNQTIAEESGTAIGDALATAVNRVKDSTNKTKIVVLLSDGVQTAGELSPEEGIKVAQAYGVKVYTIGVGSSEPAPFPSYLPTGEQIMTMQNLDFDPSTLQMIAETTGGRYFYASDLEKLKKVYEEIDQLERTKFDAGSYAHYRDLYPPFMTFGILALAANALLVATRFRSFP
jgi:Ca-activated chloride channel family protein